MPRGIHEGKVGVLRATRRGQRRDALVAATCSVVSPIKVPLHAGGRVGRDAPFGRDLSVRSLRSIWLRGVHSGGGAYL